MIKPQYIGLSFDCDADSERTRSLKTVYNFSSHLYLCSVLEVVVWGVVIVIACDVAVVSEMSCINIYLIACRR
jgi:hypothetical protein